ncbi:transcriptional regulator [Micromonospora rhizosphaerae]|uniref:Transcriptional regulator n=1 Tax=Micromonospora rhizosphaerae TaxID=568872 RepID=A0A1C6SU71_9ACTN|nr:helix-turn-helix domain-containing protein [Micromonospora rhizosphaerae]SCL33184.1 transcriptional regulator [Micromonospora rhizosphaerae]
MPFGVVTLTIVETPRTGPSGGTIDTPRHRALGTASRVTILKLVRDADGGMTAAEVAERTGQHLSTTRTHLDRLVEAGLLVKARAGGGQPGRPAWRYRATGHDDPAPAPAPYRSLAAALLDHLARADGDTRAAAGRVGEDWGRHLAAATDQDAGPVGTVLNVLDGLGFTPRLSETGADDGGTAEVHLHTCPFLDLVGRNPDAMCGLHAGVIRGALERGGAPDATAVLEPFGAPTACVVRLGLTRTVSGDGPA